MGKLEMKLKRIVSELLESDDFVTLEYLSIKCGVTRRSVQNHIQLLEAWLLDNGFAEVKLNKKPGRGIKLVIDESAKIKIHNLMSDRNFNSFDDNSRRLKMLKALIFSETELTIGFLADLFFVSRTVVLQDLEWISKWLEKFNLKLFKIQNKGIGILGDEIAKRNAIAAFFDISIPSVELELSENKCVSTRIEENHFAKLQSLYPHITVSDIVALIENAEKQFDFFLTDEYFVSLLTHLTISLARLKSGNKTEDNFCLQDNEFAFVRETAEFIAKQIEEMFDIKLPDTEITYICLHLMSYSMNSYSKTEGQPPDGFENGKNLEALAISIIESVNQNLLGSFSIDKILYFGILFHLKTSVYRMKNRIYLNIVSADNNIYLDMEILDAVKKTESIFKDICGVLPTEEEFYALTIHFMLSKNRRNQKLRAVLLNNTGIVAGVTLKNYITENVDCIKIVDIVSFPFQLDLIPESKYDFVISNIAIENCAKPIANIFHIQKNDCNKFLQNFILKL